jgi:hypothetical protein
MTKHSTSTSTSTSRANSEAQQITKLHQLPANVVGGHGYEWWGLPDGDLWQGYDQVLANAHPNEIEHADLVNLWRNRPATVISS